MQHNAGMQYRQKSIQELRKDWSDRVKKASAALPGAQQDQPVPLKGMAAIAHALSKVDLTQVEEQAKRGLSSGKKTDRLPSARRLAVVNGLKAQQAKPTDWLITKVPVIPPVFRPYSIMGDTFMPGDANELYKDLINVRDSYEELKGELGEDQTVGDAKQVYDAVKAVSGHGDPVTESSQDREVSGFLQKIMGRGGPKTGYVQQKMIAKPQDMTARSVIGVNPDLSIDEVGIPEDMAWDVYKVYVKRRLSQRGYQPGVALEMITNKDSIARQCLEEEMKERPVLYSRAPGWHKFSIMSGYPRIVKGNQIQISNLVTTGFNADFDGDENKSLILTCILDKDVQDLLESYPNLNQHKIMYSKNTTIPAVQGGSFYVFDLEDFPHGALQRTKEGEKGRIDFHTVDADVRVLAHNVETGKLEWAPVAYWSKHYQREIEIVNLSGNYQIVTDDDPRAVYGTKAGSLEMQRFTPAEAVKHKVLVPRLKSGMQGIEESITELPGVCNIANAYGLNGHQMHPTVKLNADTGWAFGAMIGDGWIVKAAINGKVLQKGICLADNDSWNATKLTNVLSTEFMQKGIVPSVQNYEAAEEGRYGSTVRYTYNSTALALFFKPLIGGERDETTSGSANKHLPPFFLSAPLEFRQGLFAGLMDTDGTITVSNAKAKPQLMAAFGTTSSRLAYEVKYLAASLGITGRITPSTTPKGKPFYMLSFSNGDIQKWGGKHMVSKTKLDKLHSVPAIQQSAMTAAADVIPIPAELALALRKLTGAPKLTEAVKADPEKLTARNATVSRYMLLDQAAKPTHSKYGRISRQAALDVLSHIEPSKYEAIPGYAEWRKVIDAAGVTWEQVISYDKTGIFEDGYDLTVPGYETFASIDGIILSNTMNVHVPAFPGSVKEAKEKLLPSKQLWAIRDESKLINPPKQELILGMYTAKEAPSSTKHQFATEAEALKAIDAGKVKLSDEIEITG